MKIWNFFNCCDVTTDIKDQYQDFYKNYWETYGFKLFTYGEYEEYKEGMRWRFPRVTEYESYGSDDDYYDIASQPWHEDVSDLWYELNGF